MFMVVIRKHEPLYLSSLGNYITTFPITIQGLVCLSSSASVKSLSIGWFVGQIFLSVNYFFESRVGQLSAGELSCYPQIGFRNK